MNDPTPALPTQSRHPWRAIARTLAALAVPLLLALPEIVKAAGLEGAAWAGAAVAFIAAVTRVLAVPAVNDALRRSGLTQWLAAQPNSPKDR